MDFTELFSSVFPFWGQLTEEERKILLSGATNRFFRKNENLHGGSGDCTGGIVVKSGCIRAYLLSEEGKEVTLYRLYPGDICMLSASCVLEAVTFDVFVDAEEDSECCIIGSGAFGTLSASNLLVENFALNMAVRRFSDVVWVLQQILFMSFDQRLAVFLYEEMCKTGAEEIRYTQEQIAKYMGSAREVVSRMLKYFTAEGIAETIRGGVRILDREKLRQLALHQKN